MTSERLEYIARHIRHSIEHNPEVFCETCLSMCQELIKFSQELNPREKAGAGAEEKSATTQPAPIECRHDWIISVQGRQFDMCWNCGIARHAA